MICTNTVNCASIPEWISAIVNVLLLILTAASVFYAYKAYNHQKERSKKEAACELAKYYAKNIIDKYADISVVFETAGITEMIRKAFPLRKLEEFDKEELLRFLEKAGISIQDLESKLNNIDPMAIFRARVSRACSEEERDRAFNSYTKLDEQGKLQIVNGQFLQSDFDNEVYGLLNELEWFAMNCKYGLADEELLYQSLHQTFLSTVWMLYFSISKRNVGNEDKLYTNLSWLFLKWRNRLVKITDNNEAAKQQLLKMAKSLKAPVYEGTKLR